MHCYSQPQRCHATCHATPPQTPAVPTTTPQPETHFLKAQKLRSRSRKGAARRQSKLSKKLLKSGQTLPPDAKALTSASPVVIVDTLAQLRQLHDELLGVVAPLDSTHTDDETIASTTCHAAAPCDVVVSTDGNPTINHSSSSSSSHPSRDGITRPWRLAVAIDCEWQPYDARDTKTPVSLLQLATDDGRVWLVDLLALLCPLPSLLNTPGAIEGGDGLCWTRDATEEEMVLGALLHRLFVSEDIMKVGFRFEHDLLRLMESYPNVPYCWGVFGAAVPYTTTISTTTEMTTTVKTATTAMETEMKTATEATTTLMPTPLDTPPHPNPCWVVGLAVQGGAHGGHIHEAYHEAFVIRDMGGGERMQPWDSQLPMRCVVDIAHVASSILGRPGLLHRRTSLRGLCRQLLHVELDKSMQVSDWGQRPLSDAQVQYAAMDVVSTITCFTALMHTHTQKHGRASLSHLHQAWCARGEGARVVSRGSRWSPDAHPAMQAPVPRPKPDWMLAAAGGCGGEEGGVGGG